MELSKELLDILLILLPGLISFIIIESLTPYNKIEFNRLLVYTVALSALTFISAITLWETYCKLSSWLKFSIIPNNLDLSKNLLSYQSNYQFSLLVFTISIIIGLFFVWIISKKFIYRFMNKINASNMTSNMEVWDDFFGMTRADAFVVVRDKENNLMYYGEVFYYSISETSKIPALYLIDVDIYTNDDSIKLYNVNELYLPFKQNSMTVEFPNFDKGGNDE